MERGEQKAALRAALDPMSAMQGGGMGDPYGMMQAQGGVAGGMGGMMDPRMASGIASGTGGGMAE